jgi:hypothetical protein
MTIIPGRGTFAPATAFNQLIFARWPTWVSKRNPTLEVAVVLLRTETQGKREKGRPTASGHQRPYVTGRCDRNGWHWTRRQRTTVVEAHPCCRGSGGSRGRATAGWPDETALDQLSSTSGLCRRWPERAQIHGCFFLFFSGPRGLSTGLADAIPFACSCVGPLQSVPAAKLSLARVCSSCSSRPSIDAEMFKPKLETGKQKLASSLQSEIEEFIKRRRRESCLGWRSSWARAARRLRDSCARRPLPD